MFVLTLGVFFVFRDYEGKLTKEIRAMRKERGLDGEREWDIWRDGCEAGEYVETVLVQSWMWATELIMIAELLGKSLRGLMR